MRISRPVVSADELAKEHKAMSEGLPPVHLADLAAHFEREKAARQKNAADRQALYDKKQI